MAWNAKPIRERETTARMAEPFPVEWLPAAEVRRRLRIGAGSVLAIGSGIGYLVTAAFLVFGANVILGDSLARVENCARIMFSHDPHLAAIGFAWGPLPTLSELPLVSLRVLWPQLATVGFAANIMSAVFMAAAVYQLHRQLHDLGIPAWANVATVITFAANPVIVFYGANGMSEAPFIFFLLIATRYLMRWLWAGDIGSEIIAGIALGAAYLCRYEGAAAGLAAIGITAAVTYVQANGSRSHKLGMGLSDGLVLGAPFLLVALSWSFASWLITGHPLDQLSSIYGTSSQLRTYMAQSQMAPNEMATWTVVGVESIVVLAPSMAILGVLGIGGALRRRDPRPLALLAVLASVLAANFATYAAGMIPHTIRYFIIAIPISTLLGAFALRAFLTPHVSHNSLRLNQTRRQRLQLKLRQVTAPLVIVGILAVGAPTGLAGLMNRTSSPSFEAPAIPQLASRFGITEQDTRAPFRFITERLISGHIDSLHLPPGSVLVDDFDGYAIIVSSNQPDEFVITSDRDFAIALSDPAGYGIKYVLVPEPIGRGQLDAINRRYPDMYTSGAGMALLVGEFVNVGDIGGNWRLYRIN